MTFQVQIYAFVPTYCIIYVRHTVQCFPCMPFSIDVLLGSTDYSTSLDMWGVGCIFVEMITGMPTFPGIRDTYDQLDKIFKLLGTPTEDSWRGVTHLPGYKPQKLGMTFSLAEHKSINLMNFSHWFIYLDLTLMVVLS